MSEPRKQIVGYLHVPGDGTFLIRDPQSGLTTKASESDRAATEPEETPDGWRWIVELPEAASTEDLDIDDKAWSALFENGATRTEDPSVHNSWCRECPSVGISHGVCCG